MAVLLNRRGAEAGFPPQHSIAFQNSKRQGKSSSDIDQLPNEIAAGLTRGDFFGNDKAAVYGNILADNVEKKMPRRMYGQTAIVLFLLAIFGLTLLVVGIGLTWWFVLPPS